MSTLHPNQTRSVCELCRRQKLRCSRQTLNSTSCARCTRLNQPCESGAQRKVGRPAVREALVRRSPSVSSRKHGSSLDMAFGDASTAVSSLELGDALFGADTDWTFECDSSFLLHSIPMPSPIFMHPSPVVLSSTDAHFASLSKVNAALHSACEGLSKTLPSCSLYAFIYGDKEGPGGMKSVQSILRSSQEYLSTIRQLHRKLGVKARGDVVLAGTPQVILESPTAFLVISCFSQIIKSLELLFTLFNTNLVSHNSIPVNGGDVAFGDVPVMDFATQASLFTEFVRHVLGQILLVLGIPSERWAHNTIWTGLLAGDRYRETLNYELGSVVGLWSVKPSRVLQMVDLCKELLLEYSMGGYK